ncbi:hypothetical protein HUO09_17015 [Vibrio sp. Y2-5]|uniref:hypothetical protein n=1 Tax=Vibrio sp. Y2-5 TaxID=2743977 RepID=UPI00166112E2|nr:hypothetical protein [Vibrio sp. Y2-5]MBD0788057.1 hypothetical protein [Vibrio sp. Y2-5]
MIQWNKTSVVLAAAAIALAGCSTTQSQVDADVSAPETNTPLNQPKVDDVVEVSKVSTELAPAHDTTPKLNTTSLEQNANTKHLEHVFESTDTSQVTTYTLMKGESYKNAIYRWLSKEGYTSIGLLLNEDYLYRLQAKVTKNQIFNSNFDDAISNLIQALNNVELTESQQDKLELHDFSEGPGEHFHLAKVGDHKVIITTSALPVTMFEVKKGDVLTNYLRLGNHYNWNVSPDFYLAANYKVPFDFNIVTERDNVKLALQQFLEQYPALTGSVYASKRQIFIESAEK